MWWSTLVSAVGGLVVGVVVAVAVLMLRQKRAVRLASQIKKAAQEEAERLKQEAEIAAKEEAMRIRQMAQEEAEKIREELRNERKRLERKEDTLDQKADFLSRKERQIEQRLQEIKRKEEELERRYQEVEELREKQVEELQRVAKMSREKAREVLLSKLEKELEREASLLVARYTERAREKAEDEARRILATAIQRISVEHTQESVVSTVDLPNEEMKGRIIGREGRNIRAFEKATGADLIVDDTPGVVVVSCFDSIRREIARRALERLVADGRIHPARIEEVVEQTRKQLNEQMQKIGREASMELDIHGLHPRLVMLLGRLKFRTSYGQNVLQHSIEVAHLCGMLAAELGFDVKLAKRCGLLHDIGKAVDHEIEGAHAQIGADLAKRYQEKPVVCNAIAAHHGDVPPETPYAVIVQAADAISASRPGARRETLEKYIQRLEKLEAVASEFEGVRNAYAIQAGREVRVIIDPEKVSDEQALVLARNIANRIADEMTFAGEIKVTVIRETRAVEYAR